MPDKFGGYRATVLVNEGRATDVIYVDLWKMLDSVPHNILSLNWRDMDLMGGPSVGEDLAGWSHSKTCSPWLHVQVETSDEWCSSGVSTGMGGV